MSCSPRVPVALAVACIMAFAMLRMNIKLTRLYHIEDWAFTPVTGYVKPNNAIICENETVGPCCAGWDVDMDEWWLHRPDWDVSSMNVSTSCFSRFSNPDRVDLMNRIHGVQWHGNCSAVRALSITSSGFAADIGMLSWGFYSAFVDNVPFHYNKHWEGAKWHYAASKDHIVCNTTDMLCYFLPITKCQSRIGQKDPSLNERYSELEIESLWWYLTRPQQWLRRRIYDYITSQFNTTELATPCTAIHVRRTDAALDRKHRHYYRLQEYLNKSETEEGANILLLTDDRSTIEEAELLHPNYNWIYVNRTRFRGTESNFEDQIPSGDPALEMVVILSEMKLSEQCDRIVHTKSGYAKFLAAAMRKSGKRIKDIRIDIGETIPKLKKRESRAIGEQFLMKLDEELAQARAAKAGNASR